MNVREAEQPLDLSFLADWEFIGNVGDYKSKQACVMSAAVAAVRVARGVDMNGATDELECVDPGVRKLCIVRNDRTADPAERKAWALALIPRIVGTKNKALERKRAEAIARYCARVIAAEAMDSAKLPAEAAKLRALDANASMSAIRSVANEVRDTAYEERRKRYADADDAYAAYAAAAAAAAAADDAYAAAAYAAAAYAAAAADAYAAAAAAAADDAYAAAAYAAYAAAADAAAADAADAYAAAADDAAHDARLKTRLRHLDALIEECLAITE